MPSYWLFFRTPHSGISDSRNIANIVCTMVRDGAVLDNNEVVDTSSIYTAWIDQVEYQKLW